MSAPRTDYAIVNYGGMMTDTNVPTDPLRTSARELPREPNH